MAVEQNSKVCDRAAFDALSEKCLQQHQTICALEVACTQVHFARRLCQRLHDEIFDLYAPVDNPLAEPLQDVQALVAAVFTMLEAGDDKVTEALK